MYVMNKYRVFEGTGQNDVISILCIYCTVKNLYAFTHFSDALLEFSVHELEKVTQQEEMAIMYKTKKKQKWSLGYFAILWQEEGRMSETPQSDYKEQYSKLKSSSMSHRSAIPRS